MSLTLTAPNGHQGGRERHPRRRWRRDHAGISAFCTVFAKTDAEAGLRGMSAFVVEANRDGVTVGNLETKLRGIRGSSPPGIT